MTDATNVPDLDDPTSGDGGTNQVTEQGTAVRDAVLAGRTALGIELGSSRIKACLIGEDSRTVLATAGAEWENQFVDRRWTYGLDDVWTGLRSAYADLAAQVRRRYAVEIESVGAIGISAMMHGYLAFDADGELLVPFRTWRNTSTEIAAAQLTDHFRINIPQRWSIAHHYQAILDQELHVPHVRFLTTLAGYVHWQLTGQKVLGVGDASGMFPIDTATCDFDRDLLASYDDLVADRGPGVSISSLLPTVRPAGRPAGQLSENGATLLDPTGTLRSGIPLCPPEGDAGTGMVATNAVAPRTGNVSAGTSVFAMVVLERPLRGVHHEIDLVTTPAGDPVAMVHCNNGASELAAWAGLFRRFAAAAGLPLDADAVFETLYREALQGDADAGGLIAYNFLSGEPITQLHEGRPMIVRTPESRLTLANFIRAEIYAVFGTLSLGMRILANQEVALDRIFAHGGMFRTAGVAQRLLAGALDAPVAVGSSASEGGAWGIAVLASYLSAPDTNLNLYLRDRIFDGAPIDVCYPDPNDSAGFAAFLDRYRAGLTIERMATATL